MGGRGFGTVASDGGGPVSVRVLGYVAIAEAISFGLLLVAMGFKYGLDEEAGVTTLGPIHGMLFLAYVVLALVVHQQQRWSVGRTALVLAAAVVPIAGWVVGRRLLDEEPAPV